MEKKSNLATIVSVVVILAIVVLFAVYKPNKNDSMNMSDKDDSSMQMSSSTDESMSTDDMDRPENISIPTPSGDWVDQSISNDITFSVPQGYYISHPVIGECKDVVSISTQTESRATIPVALIYKDGCITDTSVTTNFTRQENRNGYIFQTSSQIPDVINIFTQIVATAK